MGEGGGTQSVSSVQASGAHGCAAPGGGYRILEPVSHATASALQSSGMRSCSVVVRAPVMMTNLTPSARSASTSAIVSSEIAPAPIVDVGSRRHRRSTPSRFRTTALCVSLSSTVSILRASLSRSAVRFWRHSGRAKGGPGLPSANPCLIVSLVKWHSVPASQPSGYQQQAVVSRPQVSQLAAAKQSQVRFRMGSDAGGSGGIGGHRLGLRRCT
jgi:hypothetical protein